MNKHTDCEEGGDKSGQGGSPSQQGAAAGEPAAEGKDVGARNAPPPLGAPVLGRSYSDIENSAVLNCGVCREIMVVPVTMVCGRSGCEQCLGEWYYRALEHAGGEAVVWKDTGEPECPLGCGVRHHAFPSQVRKGIAHRTLHHTYPSITALAPRCPSHTATSLSPHYMYH